MSVDATRWAWGLEIKPTAKLVLLSMADRAGEGNECWPSITRLISDTCLDRKTVISAIKELESLGFLRVLRITGNGNKYQLVGVLCRETSPKNGTATSSENGTSGKYTPVPKTEPHQSQKRDDHQYQKRDTEPTIEPKKNRNTNTTNSDVRKPDGVSDQVWQDFKKLRKAKKAAITETAIIGIRREADKARMSLEEALSTCCERGWVGFKSEWVHKEIIQSKNKVEESYQERASRVAAERMAEFAPGVARKISRFDAETVDDAGVGNVIAIESD